MSPVLIGYFPRRPRPRADEVGRAAGMPPQIEELCNVGRMNIGVPPDWVELWLHNELWLYSNETRAWAAAVDTENLRRIGIALSRRYHGVTSSFQRAMEEYIALHVPSPAASFSTSDPRFHWDLYAYRMFPIRFASAADGPLEISEDHLQPAEPLPEDYLSLGFDVVSRDCDNNTFHYSPIECNGLYTTVAVNRYCLLDHLETAVQLARDWSVRPPEPGPYFIVDVLRKRLNHETAAS
jgi:hypothetical protein